VRPVTREPGVWARRAQRLWRRRSFRRFVTGQAPALAAAGLAVWLATSPAFHAAVAARWAEARTLLTARPEFAITRVALEGASPAVEAEIRASLFDVAGASSLDLDVDRLRRRVESFGWVETARVALEAPVGLRVTIVQREAAAVWRLDGEPYLIDAFGAVAEPAFSRADHPDLPLVAGAGAADAVQEALALFAAAGPLAGRLRGLVRVGGLRWNAMLTGPAPGETLTLKLPVEDAVAAMARAVGMQVQARLFDRDLAEVDLRLPDRPTVRPTARGRAAIEAALALPEDGA